MNDGYRQHVHLISSEHSDNIKNLDRKIQNLIIGVSQDQKTFDELKDVINAENASNKAHISQEFQKVRSRSDSSVSVTERSKLTRASRTARLLLRRIPTKGYSRVCTSLILTLAKKGSMKPTKTRLSGYLTSRATKSSLGILSSTGLKMDTVLTGFVEKQAPVNRH